MAMSERHNPDAPPPVGGAAVVRLENLETALRGHGYHPRLLPGDHTNFYIAVDEISCARTEDPFRVFCRTRSLAGDELWFYDNDGHAFAPAYDITKALMFIMSRVPPPEIPMLLHGHIVIGERDA
ncbi:hypothetical protein [Spirillospora sp. CA-294931]|uniref:hypothetical protein n=1 Tax=Spirillospora sp. CA-294931 TaxID=3240042 RepID=UPI003D91D117